MCVTMLPMKIMYRVIPFICLLLQLTSAHIYQSTEEISEFHIDRPIDLNTTKTELYFPHIQGEIPKNTFSKLPDTTLIKIRGSVIYVEPGAFNGLQQLRSLDLSWNKIGYLVNGTFNGLAELVTLDLQGNFINYIEPGSFEGLINLLHLKLGHNQHLQILRDDAFVGLPKLTNLQVDYCGIHKIEENAFYNLQNLRNLSMNNNELIRVPTSLFEVCVNLKKLEVRENKIDRIESQFLQIIIHQLHILDISGNPYSCDATKKRKAPKSQTAGLVILDECDKKIAS